MKQMKYTGHATLDVDKKELREPCFSLSLLHSATFNIQTDPGCSWSRFHEDDNERLLSTSLQIPPPMPRLLRYFLHVWSLIG